MRRVSKYDLDRGTVDFRKLQKEKEKDMTDNVKIKREEFEKDVTVKKVRETTETQQKIKALQEVRKRQERERREFIRK